MSGLLDDNFRAVGFTGAARDFPRNDLALSMFAAWNNVGVDHLPPAMRYFPNEATKQAWARVADAAIRALTQKDNGHE